MKKLLVVIGVMLGMVEFSHAATSTAIPAVLPTSVCTSSVSASGAPAAVTVAAPGNVGAYSTGFYNYVTHVRIEQYAAGTLTGGATPVTCTTTNLNTLAYKLPTAQATGAVFAIDQEFTNAIQATQGQTAVVSCPATASVIWNVQVCAYSAN